MRVEVRAARDTPPEADVLAVPVGPGGLPESAASLDGRIAGIAALLAFVAAGAMVQQAASVADAIDLATDLVGQRGAVLVAGSLYTVAEAREHLLGIAGDRSFGLR